MGNAQMNRDFLSVGLPLVSYYLPGNRSAHPPEHLVHGSTGHTVDEQTHFDVSRIAGVRVDEQCKLYSILPYGWCSGG